MDESKGSIKRPQKAGRKAVAIGTKDKPTSWGGVADWYDGLVGSDDSYQSALILPNLLRLVDPKAGDRILDIACGQGFFSHAFAEKGASVTGADISAELVNIAKARAKADAQGGANPQFHVAPADRLSFVKDASFDKAVIVLALQNIENLSGAIADAHRGLKRGGKLFVVLNHPAFRIPKRSSWGWDDAAKAQYRRVDGYMSESRVEIDMNPGARRPSGKKVTVSFHRPLQVYFKALTKSGLAVTRLEEWTSHRTSVPGTRSAEENRMRAEIPIFLLVEATKL